MVFCRSCGRELKDADRFCDACGLSQQTLVVTSVSDGDGLAFDKEIELAKLQTEIVQWHLVYAPVLAVALSIFVVSISLLVNDLLTKPDGRTFWVAIALWTAMLAGALVIMLEVYRRNGIAQRRFATGFEKIYRGERVYYSKKTL